MPNTVIRFVLGCTLTVAFSNALLAETPTPSTATMQKKDAVVLSSDIINLSLTDAVFLGLRQNRQIQSAYVDRIAQKYDLKVADATFTPRLLLSGQYSSARDQDGNASGGSLMPTLTATSTIGTQFSLSWESFVNNYGSAGQFRNDGATVQIIQPLLRGAGNDVATAPVRLAHLQEASNRLALQAKISQTITQIIIAYCDLLRAQETLDIAQNSLRRSTELLDVNHLLIDSGRMAAVDITQTEADVATQEVQVEQARNQLRSAQTTLLQYLGLDLASRIRASDELSATPTTIRVAEAEDLALAHQPDYLTRLIAIEQAELNLKVAKSNSLWDVSLVAGVTQGRQRIDGQTTYSSRQWQSYVGVRVQIPIGDPATRQAEVHATVDLENAKLQQADAIEKVKQTVDDSVREVLSRWRQYQLSLKAVELSRKALDIEREKLRAGRSGNFQVLSFESSLRTAESNRLSALIGYRDAQAYLDQQLGMTLRSWDISLND